MGRIVGVDYGIKRCGVAATDPFQIIVNPVTTVDTGDLMAFLTDYFSKEKVDKLVVGLSLHKDGTETYVMNHVRDFVDQCRKIWPELVIDFQDESFSSSQAKEIALLSGIGKKKRKDKSLLDKISAVIILQRYLKHI